MFRRITSVLLLSVLKEFPQNFPEVLIRTGEAATENEFVFWRDFINEISKFFAEPAPQHPLFRTNLDWRSKFYDDRDLGFFWLKYFAQYRQHNAKVLGRQIDKQTFYPNTAFGLLRYDLALQ